MLQELLSIFWSRDTPVSSMGSNFSEMLKLAWENTLDVGEYLFQNNALPEARTKFYQKDVQINRLERNIRKQVAIHLAMPGNLPDVPYCLLLMSLVKDVERIGDYAKNLSELSDLNSAPFPDDELVLEMREIRQEVEATFGAVQEIFVSSDRDRAFQFITMGRIIAHRCDALVQKIANSSYDAANTATTVLATRFYKRIGGHLLNILSGVVMPLHKIDFYDEDEVPEPYRSELKRHTKAKAVTSEPANEQ